MCGIEGSYRDSDSEDADAGDELSEVRRTAQGVGAR